MNNRGVPYTDLLGPQGTVRSPVVLMGGVISLLGTIATLLLIPLLEGDARGAAATGKKLGPLDGWLGNYLLLFVLAPAIVASLALITVATMSLLRNGSGAGSSRPTRASPVSDPPPVSGPRVNTSVDASLESRSWTSLVEECVDVVDELDRHMAGFDPPRQEVAGHVILRLQEILGRSGVEVISGDVTYDPGRHKAGRAGITATSGVHITRTLSPGFAVGRRVLRRARVQVDDVSR